VLHGGVNLLEKVDELKARSNATKAELEVTGRGGAAGGSGWQQAAADGSKLAAGGSRLALYWSM
jgi:hypothetical protein